MHTRVARHPLRVLVIEGGGMRTSYLCGVLCTLALHGIRPEDFDLIVVVSAGGISAAYYIAGQAGLGHQVWRHLTGERFIRRFRDLLVGKPTFDLDYLEEVCTSIVPLNVEKVATATTELRVVVTDCHTGMPAYIRPTAATLIPTLMASSAYPPFARPRRFDGRWGCDGAITDPLPVRYAIERGGTHILVLSTTPPDFRKPRSDALTHALAWLAFPGNERVRAAYARESRLYNAAKEICARPPSVLRIVSIQPDHPLPSWQLDPDERHMIATLNQGELDTVAALERGDVQRLFTD